MAEIKSIAEFNKVITFNILYFMDKRGLQIIDGNKLRSYAKALGKVSGIHWKRLETLLDPNVNKNFKLIEVYKIAKALKIGVADLVSTNFIKEK